MERSVLFLTVPAAERGDLLEMRAYVLESLAAGVLILGPGVTWEVVALPELGDVKIVSAPPQPTEPAAPKHSPLKPPPDNRSAGRPAFTGAGAREKRLIYEALVDYRERHGLGCFGAVAAHASGLTVELLRGAMLGASLPMEIWRKIGKALDAQAGKGEAVHGET